MRGVVISNGAVCNYHYYQNLIHSDDYIICADGAIRHCLKMGVTPDLWIGDFDSCVFDSYIENYPFLKDVEVIRLNPEKDMTDTHSACDIALDYGCDEILILSGLGSRFDHTLSNVHLLEYLFRRGVSTCISDENNTIRIFNDTITINRSKKYLSLIPLDENVKVIKTTGLKYMLENKIMKRCDSLGISNEITSDIATITIEDGIMLAVESDD